MAGSTSKLGEMLIDQLKDAYSAEKQALQAMRRAQRKATSEELRRGLEAHLAQSEEQRDRVEQALETLGARAGRKVCEAMRGLVEEASHELEEYEKGPLLDLVIVAAQQRIEHYEIAAYGTIAEYANATGKKEVASIVAGILEEEKKQDALLTELTRTSLLKTAQEHEQKQAA